MLSDAPNPSWHPALMPNSTTDLHRTRPTDFTPRSAQDGSDDDGVLPAATSGQTGHDHNQGSGLDAWFPDDGTADNWMEDATHAPPASTDEPGRPGPAEFAEGVEPNVPSKHETRMSFARTVSHEVNWNDEDDAEWTLPQTEADPLKFLPQSDRTNSFPLATPLKRESPHELDQPLPSNEAEQLLRDIEREESAEDGCIPDATSGATAGGADGPGAEDGHDSLQYVSGGFNGIAEDEVQARFDEGVPLVSADHAANEGGDLFREEAVGEEDDFFSNVQQHDAPRQQEDFQPPPMERKSTMDVLNGLNIGSAGSGFVPLEETAEESEPDGETAQPHDTQEPPPTDSTANSQDQTKADGENLDEKWKAMFADDDDGDFLPDEETESKDVDPTAFLGSDDEGLLDDSEAEQPDRSEPVVAPGSHPVPSTQAAKAPYLPPSQTSATTLPANPYLPAASPATPSLTNPYLPAVAPAVVAQPPVASPFTVPSSAPPAPARYGYGPPPPQEKNKAQSFVDKSKGGYTSPYDLPMEVVKPKKRASAQSPRNASAPVTPSSLPPPPRSASLPHPPPPPSSAHSVSRPGSSHSTQAAPTTHKPSHESFFEELPITAKARPASRSSHKSQPSPTQPSPYGPPQSVPPPVHSSGPPAQSGPEAGIPQLVAPPRVNPYASLSSPALTPAVPPAAATRYSPAPPGMPHANGPVPGPVSSRYSPAPASRQPSSGYAPAPAVPGPPILPHQPRTSSPLAHFEISHDRSRPHAQPSPAESGPTERRSSNSLYDSRLQRVPSLPPTREVDEEEAPSQTQSSPGRALPPQQSSPTDSRYAPPSQRARQTPPPGPPPLSGQALLSPPKRTMSSHSPLASPYDFAPPPRSQTQSPGALYGSRGGKPADSIPRPSSVHDSTSPRSAVYPAAAIPPAPAPTAPSTAPTRPRGASLNLNVIPPTDGREQDPLQRWRGAPLITWGVGGTVVTMFPKEVPRYGMNQSIPAVIRSPGEVKVKNIKDIIPLEDRLAKFPGPLKGKSKKKETIAWLTTGIESLERGLPNSQVVHSQLSHDDKRAIERVLLWKILRLFVEHDGVLEGNPTVEKAVRDILTPGLETSEIAAPYTTGATALGLGDSLTTVMRSDAVSSSTVEQIRRHLLSGDREKAVWTAVDQRLWGHALLLASALAPNLYRQVAQEFVKKEVNLPGHNNEPLATLYEVLSGNHEESVDELVPVHARAGLQLMAKDAVSGPSKDGTEGLDKWRETLGLILSNRSLDDVRAINSLGVLLSGYGRAEAAHICFMFSRGHTVFGGLDDPASNFVLVGSDHKRQAEQFAKEIEPLLLSEVYEYGQSLAGGSNVPVTNPHLAAYKLEHALALAEYGFRDKALQYCDAIAAAITSQTKRSPYHHPILENAVEDLMKRLKQAPKEESSSWIPKPSMNKVSDSMWNRFNKFVAGDDNDDSAQGATGDGEAGPFARVAGGTPTISRTPSVNNLETFGAAVPSYGMPVSMSNPPPAASAPPTRAASRYAPGGAGSKSHGSTSTYAPRSSLERTSSELNRGSFELPRRSLELQSGHAGNASPARSGSPAAMYTPYGADFASQEPGYNSVSQPTPPQTSARQQSVSYPGGPANGVAPDSGLSSPPSGKESQAPGQTPEVSGYQAPSYGYEPPSFTPYEAPAEEKTAASDDAPNESSYEPPSYQPYGYEPPSYEPGPQPDSSSDSDEEQKPKPKKKGIMYDDDDDFPTPKPAEKTKEEKDRENAEMFRKAAEEDGKIQCRLNGSRPRCANVAQPNVPKPQSKPRGDGVSPAGSVAARRTQRGNPAPTNPSAPNWARPTRSTTTRSSSAG